jgi:VanZ family protein
MKMAFKYYGPAILWALFILMMCSINLGKVSHSPMFFPGFDKLTHCGFFLVLVVFCCYGFIKKKGITNFTIGVAFIITLCAILCGGIIEILQLYIFTWRSGEWNDLFADTIGAGMGIFSIGFTINAIQYVNVKE